MLKTIFNLNLRQKLFILTIVFIPYSELYLFGNPYLFLPMVFFILYFILSISKLNGLLGIRGVEKFVYPWIVLWFLILIGILVNYLPDYFSIYRSILQRRIIYLVFFIIFLNELRRNSILLKIVDDIIIFSVTLMVLFYFFGIGLNYRDDRLNLFGAGSNSIGVWLVLGILLISDRILRTRISFQSILYYLTIIVGAFMVIIATASRKSLGMLIVGTIIFLLFINKSLGFKIKILFPFLFLCYYGFNYAVSNPVLQKRMDKEIERQNLGGRLPIWEETLKIIHDNPVLGAGPGLVREELAASSLGRSRAAHNEFLTIGTLAGIPGVLLFIYFLLILGRRAYIFNRVTISSTVIPFVFWILVLMYLSTAGGALNAFLTWFLFSYIAAKSLPIVSASEIDINHL